MRPLIHIDQREADGALLINTNIPDPFILIDILLTVQKQIIMQARSKMELKPEAKIITREEAIQT